MGGVVLRPLEVNFERSHFRQEIKTPVMKLRFKNGSLKNAWLNKKAVDDILNAGLTAETRFKLYAADDGTLRLEVREDGHTAISVKNGHHEGNLRLAYGHAMYDFTKCKDYEVKCDMRRIIFTPMKEIKVYEKL